MVSIQQNEGLVASASITINAPIFRVWDALINPQAIKVYMFGAHVMSDWEKGSEIVWRGQWKSKTYEDKGTILEMEKERLLQYSHYSPLSGLPDEPENYHLVTFKLTDKGAQTHVSLMQDNNPNERVRQHSEENWVKMLQGLKRLLEA